MDAGIQAGGKARAQLGLADNNVILRAMDELKATTVQCAVCSAECGVDGQMDRRTG